MYSQRGQDECPSPVTQTQSDAKTEKTIVFLACSLCYENLYSPQTVELRNNKNNDNLKKTT